MSSFPPKLEARRRPVSVLALKLWGLAEALDERLEDPGEVLDILVSSAAKGEQTQETWDRLHEAATRFDKTGELAIAYEHIAVDKRVRVLHPEQQAFIFLQATRFFSMLGDSERAAACAERAIAAVPGHAEAFARLETLLTAAGKLSQLVQHYLDASQLEADPGRRRNLLERAFSTASRMDESELVIESGQRLLRLAPENAEVREELMRRLIGAGRHKDVVELLEQALARDPPPPADEDKLYREQLVDLCFTVLGSPERALTHVEGLLRIDPTHPMALGVAESLLDNEPLMTRAAAALSDAFERSNCVEREVFMLSFELRHVRGPRRIEVQRRLGILRQDALKDPAGALELLAPVVAGDPGDDALRRRFVDLSLKLHQSAEAARLLSRALQSHRDPAVRARVGVDVGDVYLKSGDVKRGQLAFQKVLETDADERATLAAAYRLSKLYADSGDLEQLGSVLEIVVRLEPEKELRQAAARRLAQLCDAGVADGDRAILAFRALVGSPWTDEALIRLETLYRAAADDVGLSEVLAFRAERSEDPVQARELAAQALELRVARTRDPESAIAAYHTFSNSFGSSREVNARLLPLLEQTGRFSELAEVLLSEIELSAPAERAKLWLRLAHVRQTRLSDPRGALAALEKSLELDAADRMLRAALEKLLKAPEVRLRAAALLAPLYAGEPSIGQLRVLEARAEGEPEVRDRLAAAEQAVSLSRGPLRDPERALEIAARALADAVSHAPELVPRWLSEVQGLGAHSPERRARALFSALARRAVDSRELFELAQAAGDAAHAAGDLPRAIEIYRRALAFDPSSRKLFHAIDALLAQQGVPSERLALYEAALAGEQEPQRRRDWLQAAARLQRVELSDLPGATLTLRRAVSEQPRDLASHDALVALLLEMGDFAAAAIELERVLPLLEGERRTLALRRLAEVAERAGDKVASLAWYRELLQCGDRSEDVLANLERLAIQQGDRATLRSVLEQRLLGTSEPRKRVRLLERLGDACAGQLGDSALAVSFWLEGARLSQGAGSEPKRARRLYERVLDADPRNWEAAECLLEICAAEGDWARVRDAFATVLEGREAEAIVTTLLGLEERAVSTGAASQFVLLVERALERRLDAQRTRLLTLAKARALGSVSGRAGEAAALFRSLIDGSGAELGHELEAFARFLATAEPSPERREDRRWLFRLRAERSSDPAAVLLEWARVEEHELGDRQAARGLYERILCQDPEQREAWTELARLQALDGEPEKALASLHALRERVDGEWRSTVDLRIATLLIESLGRPAEALHLVRPILALSPSDTTALCLVHRALALPETRAEAAGLLEQAAEAFEDPARRGEVIEALLAVSVGAPELSAARSRWLTQLLETKADQPEEALRISLRGVEAAPTEVELWRVAEQVARRLDKPHPVVDAYMRAFERTLTPDVAEELGQRMVEFYGEWFDEPERVVGMLQRILELSPTSGWAFDRLKLAFSDGARWQELFQLYDRRLDAAQTHVERIDLLREAAMAARDFAEDPERAIGYLEALNREWPGDQRVEGSLERLYERHGKKRPLIELLSARLHGATALERGELVARIAALWLDLAEPRPALSLAETLLKDDGRREEAVQLLERLITLPAAREFPADQGTEMPLLLAIALLKRHYRQTTSAVDVVRMLELEVGVARSPEQRRVLLEEIVGIRLGELGDALGAFETTAELVLLDAASKECRATLAQLAVHMRVHARQADVLVAAARAEKRVEVRASLLNEAAAVQRGALSERRRAVELYRECLRLADVPAVEELVAARALSELLRDGGDPSERVAVLERLSDLVGEASERRAALGEAASLAFDTLGDAPRAIAAYRRRLADDRTDLEAMNGLCTVLTATGHWDELVATLEARAAIEKEPEARRDRVRIAVLHAETRGDRAAAIEAWRRVVALHGGDRASFDAQRQLLAAEQRWPELGRLFELELDGEVDAGRRRELYIELGMLHEQRTQDRVAALESYVAAGDWPSALRVAGAPPPDRATGRTVCARLLALATVAWQSANAGPDCEPARAADWALSELSERLLEDGEYAAVAEGLLAGSALGFEVARRRDLRRQAACLVSDKLGDSDRAIELFQGLLEENSGDEAAVSSVTRLALLLEERGRFEEIARLWENQARARASTGDVAAAQVLWARAGELSEERLRDVDRALAAYDSGAALAGEVCLEALARLHRDRGRIDLVADALERLCRESAADTLGERALSLAEAYVALGKPLKARDTLEKAAPRVVNGAPLRARLGELYREIEDFTALAQLTEEEAERAAERGTRLLLLREAALLHLDRRGAPAPAIPLLERAIEIEAGDSSLRLLLARALYETQRFEEAAGVLREQVARYGGRRPRGRALVHFELARTLLAASDRASALLELDIASKIDPTHPSILEMLARTALEQGELERAERMYRSLLLVAVKAGDSNPPSKSEALYALGDVATCRGDALRAEEFTASAFEAAGESPREALALERTLKARGRSADLVRVLELRLGQPLAPGEALRVLGDLAEMQAVVPADLDRVRGPLLKRAARFEGELEEQDAVDDAAWAALGRAYAALGDRAGEGRVLERRIDVSTRVSGQPPDGDLLYRLAAVRLAVGADLDGALESLERALELAPDFERADALLKGALMGEIPPRAVLLMERIARARGDANALVHAIERRISAGDADVAIVREGIELADRLEDPELGRRLLSAALTRGVLDKEGSTAAWLRLELSRRHRNMGDVPAALELEEQAAGYLSSADAEPLLLAVARESLALGDAARAARALESLRREDPENGEVYRPLLDLYRQHGPSEKLVELLEATAPLVNTAEERLALRLEQADVLLERLGHRAQAISLLQDIVRDAPAGRTARLRLAELLEADGRESELAELLLTEFDEACDAGDVAAEVTLAIRVSSLLERQDRAVDALDVCRRALERDPTRRELLEQCVRLAETSGEPERLADALESLLAVERGASAAALCRRLLTVREQLSDYAGGERALSLGLAACPNDAELCDELCRRYRDRDEPERVAEVLQRAFAARPDDKTLLEQLLEAERAALRPEQALSALELFLSHHAGDNSLYSLRANLLAELGRDEEAVEDLERISAQDPAARAKLVEVLERAIGRADASRRVELAFRLVDILEQDGDWDGARTCLTELARDVAGRAVLERLAALELRLGNLEGAIAAYTQLVEGSQGAVLVLAALAVADLCQRTGRPERARPVLEQALETEPRSQDLRTALGRVLEATGAHCELGELTLLQAVDMAPSPERGATLGRAGKLFLAGGETVQAVGALELARSEVPDSLEVVVLLARAYTRAGRLEEALAELNTTLETQRGKRLRALAAVFEEKANVHLEGGSVSEALDALAKAFEMDPKNGRLGLRLGRTALEAEEGELAQRALRAIAIMKTADADDQEGARPEIKAEANYALALLAQKAGDPRKAKILAAKAVSESAEHAEARALLAQFDKR